MSGAIKRVLALHRVEGGGEYCMEDGFHWPCPTARACESEDGEDSKKRAEEWARDHAPTRIDGQPMPERLTLQFAEWLRDAYLAGSTEWR